MTQEDLGHYTSRSVRACVLLHETHMQRCIATWKEAKAHNLALPQTTDSDYQSLETLLSHILRAARGYMVWVCKQLGLPDPEIAPAPALETTEHDVDAYLGHLLQRWHVPLVGVRDDQLGPEVFLSNWGVPYTIDAMLEHAVMHPIRHDFQLRNLLNQAQSKST